MTKSLCSGANRGRTTRDIGDLTRSILFVVAFLPCFSYGAGNLESELQSLINRQKARTEQLRSELLPYARQVERIGRETVLPPGDNPARHEMESVRTVVFISRSMPETDLLNLFKQGSGRSDIAFAFRGWGDGSMKDIYDYTYGLMRKLPENVRKKPPQIIVHPKSFREYGITHVPAVAHRDTDGKWYLIQGMLTIDATVEKIRRREFNYRLSQQWRVSEPDQAEILRRQVLKHDWKNEGRKAAQAVEKKLEGLINLPTFSESRHFSFMPLVAASYDIRHPATGRVVYPKGTRFNVLALDPKGRHEFVVIDGNARWQIEFARNLGKQRPGLLVFYTKLGGLRTAGIPASPLDPFMQRTMRIVGVPSYYSQNGMNFEVFQIHPR